MPLIIILCYTIFFLRVYS